VRMEQLPNDRLLVVICSKTDNLDVKYKTNDGETNTLRFGRTCLGTGPDPACVGVSCANCTATPSIGYTTQQMSVNGTQNLNADGGGGGPYTWSIISGGGTLSKTVTANNEMTVYTAPSSNPGCAYNPTIQVKDYCGHTKTLKLAVNAFSSLTVNAYFTPVITADACAGRTIRSRYFNCEGGVLTTDIGQASCSGVTDCGGNCCSSPNSCNTHPNCDGACPGCTGATNCCASMTCGSANAPCTIACLSLLHTCGPACLGSAQPCDPAVTTDLRGTCGNTNTAINGCCPAKYIV
jgi:hypothetical protein